MSARIVHPYGKVGFLPWQGHPGVPFGDHTRADLLSISKDIKTFTEGLDDQAMVAEIQGMVVGAENIVFLGFSFHPQNLELIRAPAGKTSARRVFATALGASTSDQGAIKASVAAILNRAVNVHRDAHVEADKLSFDFLDATSTDISGRSAAKLPASDHRPARGGDMGRSPAEQETIRGWHPP